MPTIIPIRDLRKTSEISEMAHNKKEPDQAIFEAEKEIEKGGKTMDLKKAKKKLDKKYYG